MSQLYLNTRLTKVLNLLIKSEQKKYKLRSSLAKLVVLLDVSQVMSIDWLMLSKEELCSLLYSMGV